ncbi:unnamed protein product [Clonostachys rosea]|uniref:Alcohol dehydrogenase-like C-terminal domain-containing protein n=1 Tax=Bionectria ochroleuca TaxID=29856 RepID=A0ABY6UNG4_BIOOC|nr:unnamed protein product [Clonostachys rosea]
MLLVPVLEEPTDVIIKTTSAALCGSELHRYRGHSKVNMQPGYVCGHEGIGIVHEVGSSVTKYVKGDHVIVPFLSSWLSLSKTEMHYPAGFELTSNRYNGAKRAFEHTPRDQWKGMSIAVICCGPVALCSIISAREYKPARIFAIDSISNRLEAAKRLGCIPLNFKEVDVVAEIKKATDGNGVHAVIEGVGLSPALETAFDIVCPGGKISSFGVHNADLPFSAADCYNRDVHIQFGRCPIRVVFEDALATLIHNKDLVEKMNFIDLVLPGLDESFEDALKRFERGELNKVVFKPNGPETRLD